MTIGANQVGKQNADNECSFNTLSQANQEVSKHLEQSVSNLDNRYLCNYLVT
jgi:hypothetical protein